MKEKNIERLLYKLAALLAVVGIALCVLQPSDNYLGLYFILAGHILGAAGIIAHMKRTNDLEHERRTVQQPTGQLQKK
ncbi:hypothetical protein [Pontibacter mangrovi]|uniref:Uncharacterized protein n=1 Tax=Pontibacter mangrovi TaxID=2589816 RepID=A0A501WB99_9BACT|nr:hypothetical protein [Pontibacter mangrovi]TPE44087.1 hypothetical protein FJM65_11770 [Pontibacter mangrovi]